MKLSQLVVRAVFAGVDLQFGGFDGKPYLAARAEREFCYRRGCDVYQSGWLSVEVEPDPVGQQCEPGDFRGPAVAGAAGLGVLAADDYGGGADCDQYLAVHAVIGGDEAASRGERHLGAAGVAGVQVEADEFGDVVGGGLAGDLLWGALLHDAPGLEDDELVSEYERFERVVGAQQTWPGEIRQVVLELGLHIKAGSRIQG